MTFTQTRVQTLSRPHLRVACKASADYSRKTKSKESLAPIHPSTHPSPPNSYLTLTRTQSSLSANETSALAVLLDSALDN